ncbi:MAG: glutamine-hydrolyzing carbamoyl-phosphate synthase small subunit [Deltaproteobacteria bacterium]|nr:glutamine-hydrolyzing carbamoyl-phosphate synthase small subunit [Deltaproteobacteria bacterium]
MAHLALADGTLFKGYAYGAEGSAIGEAVFTTGMTGYQEVLTDPSYTGQLVTMTAPQIGNTGINTEDAESIDLKATVSGFIMRDASPVTDNYRSEKDLHQYLSEESVVAITGIDTRRLTRLLRDKGSQNGCIGTEDPDTLVDKARSAPSMEGLDLAKQVSTKKIYEFTEGRGDWGVSFDPGAPTTGPTTMNLSFPAHVVAMDFGAKRNILRCLVDAGCKVTVVPADTSADDILGLSPDGVFLSSGPGDPAAVDYAVDTIKSLLGKKPIFGICLGHQLLARALGAKTFKLKFGHRGLNQPVLDNRSGRVEITTQNHGFVVDVESIGGVAESTHVHLNDGTSEGLSAPSLNAFSVQYHPEAAAGPHDSGYLFKRFTDAIEAKC